MDELKWAQMKQPRLPGTIWEYVYLLPDENGGGIPLGYVYDYNESFPYMYELTRDPDEFHENPYVSICFAETVEEAMGEVERTISENGYEWAKKYLGEGVSDG